MRQGFLKRGQRDRLADNGVHAWRLLTCDFHQVAETGQHLRDEPTSSWQVLTATIVPRHEDFASPREISKMDSSDGEDASLISRGELNLTTNRGFDEGLISLR
jgi:hypothetical protein